MHLVVCTVYSAALYCVPFCAKNIVKENRKTLLKKPIGKCNKNKFFDFIDEKIHSVVYRPAKIIFLRKTIKQLTTTPYSIFPKKLFRKYYLYNK